jgi:hypothetical protein
MDQKNLRTPSFKEKIEELIANNCEKSVRAQRDSVKKLGRDVSEHALTCGIALHAHLSPGTIKEILFTDKAPGLPSASLTTLIELIAGIRSVKNLNPNVRSEFLNSASATFFDKTEKAKFYEKHQTECPSDLLTNELSQFLGPLNQHQGPPSEGENADGNLSAKSLKNCAIATKSDGSSAYSITITATDAEVVRILKRFARNVEDAPE